MCAHIFPISVHFIFKQMQISNYASTYTTPVYLGKEEESSFFISFAEVCLPIAVTQW